MLWIGLELVNFLSITWTRCCWVNKEFELIIRKYVCILSVNECFADLVTYDNVISDENVSPMMIYEYETCQNVIQSPMHLKSIERCILGIMGRKKIQNTWVEKYDKVTYSKVKWMVVMTVDRSL